MRECFKKRVLPGFFVLSDENGKSKVTTIDPPNGYYWCVTKGQNESGNKTASFEGMTLTGYGTIK